MRGAADADAGLPAIGPIVIGPAAIVEAGEALIKEFEGCAKKRPDGLIEAYPDPGSRNGESWTIGWGATRMDGRAVRKGDVITQAHADALLEESLRQYADEVARAIGDAPTSQLQFDALVSFHYNTGAIGRATLTRKHKDGDFEGAAAEFARWNCAGGRVMAGLARLRAVEAKDRLAGGVDPSRVAETVETLEQLGRSWYRHNLASWSKAHASDVLASLERDVFAKLGARPAASIEPPELLNALRSVEQRGCVATAQRIRQRLAEIFAFGIAEGLVAGNPAANLGAAMRDAPPASPHPALLTLPECVPVPRPDGRAPRCGAWRALGGNQGPGRACLRCGACRRCG